MSLLFGLPLCLAALAMARAQTPSPRQFTFGDTTFAAHIFHINLGPSAPVALFSGGVTARSPRYDLKAETVPPGRSPGRPIGGPAGGRLT